MQVQENVHSQIKAFCSVMDEILLPNEKIVNDHFEVSQQANSSSQQRWLSSTQVVSKRRPLSQAEVSQKLKDHLGYTLNVKPSQISHKDAGQGLFLDGAVDIGTLLAFYPGVVYSPAYHYIPRFLDEQNPYSITRYDGTVIDAQPWGYGGDKREQWNDRKIENKSDKEGAEKSSDTHRLSKPSELSQVDNDDDDVLERRNPLALAHFANHPAKGMLPNVMICPYDFPLTENSMRAYIPNILFRNADVNIERFIFWFKSRVSRNSQTYVPTLKTVVLVATRDLQDEELLLNYRLSNSKQWPDWYARVDEEEGDMTSEDEMKQANDNSFL